MLDLRSRPFTGPGETLEKAARAVDEEAGIIRRLFEAPVAPDSPRVFAYGALTGDLAFLGYPSDVSLSGSTSLVRDQAIAGAIGESIERYSAAFVPYEDLVIRPYSEVADRAVSPWSLTLYGEDQYRRPGFRYGRLADGDPIGWVEGFSLTRERPVLVPAFAAYMPYLSRSGESPAVQQITTGLACGNTLEEAVLSAVCEVAERDAAMLAWLQARRPPRVRFDPDATPPAAMDALRCFGPGARHVTVLDVTTDLEIPTYVAAWDGPIGDRLGAVFSSSASLSPARAVDGALTELAQCMAWVNSLVDRPGSSPDPVASGVTHIEDHVLWPARSNRRSAFAFLFGSGRHVRLGDRADAGGDDVLEDIRTCVARIGRRGLEVVIVDVTAPDVRELGLHVVRAIVPGAQPLFFGSGLHRVSDRALHNPYEDRADLGVNLHPHPYP